MNEWMDQWPLWGLYLVTTAVLLLASEVGFQLGRLRVRRAEASGGTSSHSGVMGALLGLLAIMLAFTFNMAANRFAERKSLVVEEANAIKTLYLRAELLPEPTSGDSRTLLHEYVSLRVDLAQQRSVEYATRAVRRSNEIQNELWAHAVALAREAPVITTSLFIQSLNQVIDLQSKRVKAGLRDRIPPSIWLTLYFVAFVALAILGFDGGVSGPRSLASGLALATAFAAVILLITDLDRPVQNLFHVSHEAFTDLQASMAPRSE